MGFKCISSSVWLLTPWLRAMPWRLYFAELVPEVIMLELNFIFQVEHTCHIHPDLMGRLTQYSLSKHSEVVFM